MNSNRLTHHLARCELWRRPGMRQSASNQKNTLAVRLLVEQLVGFVGLAQRPSMRKQLVHVDLAVDAELRALGLDNGGESPGSDQCHLAA